MQPSGGDRAGKRSAAGEGRTPELRDPVVLAAGSDAIAESGITRRTVLAAGVGAAAAAAAASIPARALAVAREAGPELLPLGGEVWAPVVELSGSPASALLSADGRAVPVTPNAVGFSATVELSPGENDVIASVSGRRATARATYTGRLLDRPTARASATVQRGSVRLDAGASESSPYSSAPIESVTWTRRDGSILGAGTVLTVEGPWADGEQYVLASVEDAAGHSDVTTLVLSVAAGQPAPVDLQTWRPGWVEEAVVYGVVPPLFGNPPLAAVTGALDRLEALGVTVLWLSPIFATVPGDFGYAVTDYFKVRADYGDAQALRQLVEAAHARGIKVILDLPINDTSDQHPYYAQAKAYGEASRFWGFYEREADGKAAHYFNWNHLPNLQYDDAEVRTMATEAAAYWVREADVDGFRCDAAWGVDERRPDFWAGWRSELQRIRPDLLLLAEGSVLEGTWAASGFSAAYDWTDQLGQWAWGEVFGRKTAALGSLRAALSARSRSTPFRFLENNDTGKRFITRCGVEMTRAASAMLLALPGMPCIYTGQEIGAEYMPYSQTRPLDWGRDPSQLEPYYRALIAERRTQPERSTSTLEVADCTPAASVLAFLASGAEGTSVVAVNFSSAEVTAQVQIPGGGGHEVSLTLAAWSAASTAL